MKGFIVDRTYRVENDKPIIYLFGRLENGKSFLTKNEVYPYFYIKKTDLEKAKSLVAFKEVIEVSMKNFEDDEVIKLVVGEPKLIKDVRRLLQDNNIVSYEADINFIQQFLMDKNIFSTMEIIGNGTRGEHVDYLFENPELKPAEFDIKLKILSFDLEASDVNDGELYSVAIYCNDGTQKVFFVTNKERHEQKAREIIAEMDVDICYTEKELLEKLTSFIKEYDPDIVTGWNVIDFDLAFLKQKYDYENLDFTWGRSSWPNRLRIESSFARDSKAEIPGRMVLDGIHLLKSSFINLDDYKLGTAASVLLGEKKLIENDNKVAEIIRQYHEEPYKLAAYNLKDAELVIKIIEAKELDKLTILRSNLVGLSLDKVRASIASLDSVYIRELHNLGIVAPNGGYVEKEQGITGGFVKESKPGIYDYVLVLDFKSLYPSLMRTFNIDPLSHREDCVARKGEQLIKSPNETCFVNTDGILPKLLDKIWKQRDEAKKRKDAVASLAFKTLMNSFFGVLASPNCRFFSMSMANAITHFARKFITMTIERVTEMGYEVIYGDTDSVFVNVDVSSEEEASAIGVKIQNLINKEYDEYISKEYNRKSYLELEFEKTYTKFLMPRVRGSDKGAKKRYAGLLNDEMDFTGLEFVRKDWTGLAKEFQLNLLTKIFHDEEVTIYVKNFVKDLKDGKFDSLLVYSKSIRKDVASYVKTTPPHIKAARKLIDLGLTVSSPMKYVMTINGPEPVGYETGSLDYDHYIEKQIKPIADSVLCFYDTDFDELMSGGKQQTLFGY